MYRSGGCSIDYTCIVCPATDRMQCKGPMQLSAAKPAWRPATVLGRSGWMGVLFTLASVIQAKPSVHLPVHIP